ncbi:zinc finger protein ZFP2-like [Cydia strobilella]|uniref:zinc finger protein ZFP2-like n=1 Tax=Cydia strobilella TaxID=1100964 RepID=UPI0030062115
MEDVKVCRICLVMGVKMYNLHTYPLYGYFESLIGINPLSMMELPPYGCYECAALMKKLYDFKERCLIGQAELYSVLQATGKITAEALNGIDRRQLNLISNLSISHENKIISYEHDDNVQVKIESPKPANHDFLIEIDTIKQEDYDDFLMANMSSDDEPLSLQKSLKVKKKVKKKEKRGRKKKEKVGLECNGELQDIEATTDIPMTLESEASKATDASEAQEASELPEAPRKKRGRPRLSEANKEAKPKSRRTRNTGGVGVDDIDLGEYVTVVKLTPEEQLSEITKRQQSSNYLNAPFQCSLCYKGFIDALAWKHHVGKHDPSAGEVECNICKFRFRSRRALQKHAANHEKKYACRSCPYVSKTTTQAKQHQRWHKGVTYKCQYCDEISTKWTSYLSHVRIKHPSEFICGVCGYSYVSKLGLAMHKTMMHKDYVEKTEPDADAEPGPYCQECDVQFVTEEAWKRHMVTSTKHAPSNDFKNGCRACGSVFSSGEELRVHHRAAHARRRPKNYGKKQDHAWPAPCEHCSEEIPNAREYWTHFRRAHPDKPYPIQKNYICDICGKSFRGNAFLVYHKRTHFEERAYKCAVCPKAFHNRTNLQMHEKTHSDARPYPCSVCFKAFKCKGALDRHFRSHTGVKPYECEVCGKAFGQSNSRKLHVRTVHLRQPAPYVSRARKRRPLLEAPALCN